MPYITSSTQHRPNKLPQMRNISSNDNCEHCDVPFVLAELQSFSKIYLIFPEIFLLYGISGVDDVIMYLLCIFLKPKYLICDIDQARILFFILKVLSNSDQNTIWPIHNFFFLLPLTSYSRIFVIIEYSWEEL